MSLELSSAVIGKSVNYTDKKKFTNKFNKKNSIKAKKTNKIDKTNVRIIYVRINRILVSKKTNDEKDSFK